jgi:hypothetical protein
MDSDTLKNWAKVEKALREAGKTDCMFYKRAVALAASKAVSAEAGNFVLSGNQVVLRT